MHMTDVNHTLNHRQKVHYSPLTCDVGLLCAAPPAPSSSQSDPFLLTPGQLSCHPVNMRLTQYTISPCLYVTYYTFHSTSVSVDQTPQWFLLHCSIGIFRACDFRCCWWPLDYTHIVHFIQRGSELIVEHLYYISMATVSCSQQGSVAPLCKEEETYSTDSCLCMCIALLACCVCSYVYVRCEVCLS